MLWVRIWIGDRGEPRSGVQIWIEDRGEPRSGVQIWIEDRGEPRSGVRIWVGDRGERRSGVQIWLVALPAAPHPTLASGDIGPRVHTTTVGGRKKDRRTTEHRQLFDIILDFTKREDQEGPDT
jgi:hypothetical protein